MAELREMGVYADDTLIGEGIHCHLKGRATMSLRPDMWVLDLYEVSKSVYYKLTTCKQIKVCGEGLSVLCDGSVEEVHQYMDGDRKITTVIISDGVSFWESTVSMSVAGGNSIEKSMRTLIARCTSPVKIGSYQAKDMTLSRGQVFHGKTVRYVQDMAKSVMARAYFTRGALFILAKGKYASEINLTYSNGLDSISRADEIVVAKLGGMRGYAVGQLVTLPDDFKKYRLVCQSIDADNKEGVWQTELLLTDEAVMTDEDWSGGI